MKKLIALTLCAALITAPMRRAEAATLAAICLIGAAALAGGAVVFMLKTCKPKYYCVEDSDGKRFPSNATKTERIANDWKVKSGPYSSAADAAQYCPPATNSVMALANHVDEVFIPESEITIWKSYDLANWFVRDTILDDPTNFSWSETNSTSAGAAFYKASY